MSGNMSFWIITLIPLLVALAISGIKLLLLYIQLNNSDYTIVSGNGLLKTAFSTGNYGEFLTFRKLEKLGETKILTNIYLSQEDGATTEVDLISVNNTGIYVFESKNYSGWIFGDEKSKNWTQSLKSGRKHKFFNPIWQNKGHISAIDNYLDNKYSGKYFSYIIFSERCVLKKLAITTPNIYVLNRGRLIRVMKKHKINSPTILNDTQVDDIYQKLKLCTLVDEATKQRHIGSVKVKHYK